MNLKLLAGFLLCGALTACSQTITTSAVVIDEAFLTQNFKDWIHSKALVKVAQLGGSCKILNREREYYSCSVSADDEVIDLGFGYRAKGDYAIMLSSTVAHLWPPSDESVAAGKHVPSLQMELEEWVVETIPNEAVVRRTRSIVDYDYEKSF
ncbi:hypothetical protein [Aliiroseovarius sp. F20344]|uniref:hypothetical protein n=1 Tax=Aliiroseovarius sp. F20344 TaxID=2926414 RepID=UPI001FF14F19|nr:hypothetical protein [Aliiroseovarius sp. F20344]MCK0142120.1 hypothetical protein [Aliiroseovarius sp. F20344]